MAFPFFGSKKQENLIIPKDLATGINIADFLAPEAMKIESNFLQLGNKFLRTLFVFSFPKYLETNWFSPIVNMDQIFDVSFHIEKRYF